jgi:hypothetical protein
MLMPTSIVDVGKADTTEDTIERLQQEIAQEASTTEETEPQAEAAPAETVDQDPLAGTKFEGKSPEEIVDMYNNLQTAYGRMANDLGTQRKMTDRLLDLKRDEDLESNTPPPAVDTDELLNNPTAALDRYLESRMDKVQKGNDEKLKALEEQLLTEKFREKHPNFEQTAQSQEFAEWVQASPLRAQAGAMAANGDWQAADALFTEYEAEKANATKRVAAETNEPLEAARNVALESNTPTAGDDKQYYSRADLIDIKINKPHLWRDPVFQDRIYKAYAEKRVR